MAIKFKRQITIELSEQAGIYLRLKREQDDESTITALIIDKEGGIFEELELTATDDPDQVEMARKGI